MSEKVDTYSFGVLVLEIISGKRCIDVIENGSVTQSLIDHVSIICTTLTKKI